MSSSDSSVDDRFRCVVVGGAGFIGSHLVERLLGEGHRVDVVDDLSSGRVAHLATARRSSDRQLKIHHVDIGDEGAGALIGRIDPGVIFHVCGRPSEPLAEEDPAGAIEAILSTLVVVLEAARQCSAAKVVVASSVAAGTTPRRGAAEPLSEDVVMIGLAHELAHRCLLRYRERFAVDFTDLRLANVYGPRQSADQGAVVPALVSSIASHEAPPIDGDGRQTRDFVFVDDVVDALFRAIERGGGLALEVGSGKQTSIRDMAGAVGEVLAADLAEPPEREPRPIEPGRRPCDPRRAELYLGWAPYTGLREGLERTVQWWSESTPAIDESGEA